MHTPPESPSEAWARLRFAAVSRLLMKPPRRGGLQLALRELAQEAWPHPVTKTLRRFGVSTLERWYHQARAATDPLRALRRKVRKDRGGQPSVGSRVATELRSLYDVHPDWSVQLLYDNLIALEQEKRSTAEPLERVPSYASIRRYLRARALFRQRKPGKGDTAGSRRARERLAGKEIRGFEAEHVLALWHTDGHRGSLRVLTEEGAWVYPVLLAVLDDHSRLACHAQWYLVENAENLVHAFEQAFQKRDLPRALMMDNGPGTAAEIAEGLPRLGVDPAYTLEYSPDQNGKQERFWGTVEGRLLPMLEDVPDLTLAFLNEATQAWVELDYNQRLHDEIRTTPLDRYRSGLWVGRPCPKTELLRQAFGANAWRTVRKGDDTISVEGRRFEIPSRYRAFTRARIRYARWNLGVVHLVDPRADQILCRIYPEDKAKNAQGHRRRLEPIMVAKASASTDAVPPLASAGRPEPRSPKGTLPPLMRKLLADYAATGLPPAYVPKHERRIRRPEEASPASPADAKEDEERKTVP
jgi:transposase InsO family protein